MPIGRNLRQGDMVTYYHVTTDSPYDGPVMVANKPWEAVGWMSQQARNGPPGKEWFVIEVTKKVIAIKRVPDDAT